MTDDTDDLLTIDEARFKLKCGRNKVYSLGKEGRLELVKFDHRTFVTTRSVNRLIAEIMRNTRAAS